jgi:hypothetical protein
MFDQHLKIFTNHTLQKKLRNVKISKNTETQTLLDPPHG